jgi:hypothetical protein
VWRVGFGWETNFKPYIKNKTKTLRETTYAIAMGSKKVKSLI